MKKREVSKKYMESIHPAIPDTYEKLKQGRVSRREFLRMATLLGMSAGVATVASACGGGAPAEPAAPAGGEEAAPAATGGILGGFPAERKMPFKKIKHAPLFAERKNPVEPGKGVPPRVPVTGNRASVYHHA